MESLSPLRDLTGHSSGTYLTPIWSCSADFAARMRDSVKRRAIIRAFGWYMVKDVSMREFERRAQEMERRK